MQEHEESAFSHKEPCPECGSRDNLARYTDGHGYCFGCHHYEPGDGAACGEAPATKAGGLLPVGEAVRIPSRGLTQETCEKWGYTKTAYRGQAAQLANYRDPTSLQIVAQKVRTRDKQFTTRGDFKRKPLYGQHLWRDGGKRIVITEGEIDALSVSQAQQNKWPVVSVPNGAQGAYKALAEHLEWLNGYETIILCFDSDEAGAKAAVECATLFPPGKVRIARLPLKDANEMLAAGRGRELIDCLWAAKEYRPDGIVTVSDIKEAALQGPQAGLAWWSESLTSATYGRRHGECVALGAGTGVGKTDFLTQQIAYDLTVLKQPVGVFAFEQQPVESVQRIAGKLFHIPDGGWEAEGLSRALDDLEGSAPLYLYDHFGACGWPAVRERIRFLNKRHHVRLFYIDHLTALAAAEEDEKKGLEQIMAELGWLVKELDIWILFVSHLTTPDGKPHEEGGRVLIKQFKGSRAIGYWSHFMLGLERDQQDEDETARHQSVCRVLKDRYTGRGTGVTVPLSYNTKTGRLSEADQGFDGAVEF